ncbi:ABC transporter ATP-binding protein [Hyphomicrobium sp. D-2]|uniref:ABC transporter ATP-binding protein n=1 Tax=Hyphomicrobium sp. D-2 TaxID=3041621 RepID=UPI0024549CF7|nr:ABC transporter ATP-binding protein [Hyphomicrobium sp. D-2]MDH4982060.1 ABC transporter ATP-binding protein [Hyphomicrobium sp. D-2]
MVSSDDGAAALSIECRQDAPIPLDVSISTRAGELLALIGPSGSGKTTVLRSVAGLYKPRHGRIRVGGESWLDTDNKIDMSPQQRRVGLVFQDYALFPHLSAVDNVALAMLDTDKVTRQRRAEELLARVHLNGLAHRRPSQLSGGERQRVALARALARDPKVLLLDEPFSAVDRMTREPLKQELASLHRALDIPIVLVTHDIEEAQALADRICVLNKGNVMQIGAPDDLRLRPRTVGVARLMGQDNIATAEVLDATHIRCGSHVLKVRLVDGHTAGEKVTVLFPVDCISVIDADAEHASLANSLRGHIVEIFASGDFKTLLMDFDGVALRLKVTAREAAQRHLAVDAKITVTLDPEGIHLMRVE